ncbi:MAG: response regulator transcription factor, partial [Candidatus Bipolaricaulia bacterium]
MAQRVLVVDDEKWVVDAVRRYLEDAGYDVSFAYDGDAALEEFARASPELVILDWLLPKQDGISVAKRIRRTSTVPIIMLTAKTDEDDRLRGFAAGVDDYVVKPFSARELEARVRAVLRRFSGEESPTLQVGDIRREREPRRGWGRQRAVVLSARAFVWL